MTKRSRGPPTLAPRSMRPRAATSVTTAMLETTDVDNTTAAQLDLYRHDSNRQRKHYDSERHGARCQRYLHPSRHRRRTGDLRSQRQRDRQRFSFDFSVDDGAGTNSSGTFNFTVTPVNDEQVLATNTGTTVSEASSGNVLTTAMLENDGRRTTPRQQLDLHRDNRNRQWHAAALGHGPRRISDTFTQADIDAGLVTYDHNGSETVSDSIRLQCGRCSRHQQQRHLQLTRSRQSMTKRSLATNTGTTVNEASSGNVSYHRDAGNHGRGQHCRTTYLHRNDRDRQRHTAALSGTALGVSDTFTQADLDAGLVTYDHDGSETHQRLVSTSASMTEREPAVQRNVQLHGHAGQRRGGAGHQHRHHGQ